MTVTAVICAYWPERFANVVHIHHALRVTSTVTPDRIVILNNNPEHKGRFDHLADARTDIIEGTNTECRGKFIAGLFRPADYYYLSDDDTAPGPRTVDCLLRYACPGYVTGYWGVRIGPDGSFANGEIVFPGAVTSVTTVDAFHGRVILMAHDALVAMLAAEERVRLGQPADSYVGDDILAGLANPGSVIVPMRDDESFVDLDQGGVAMQFRDGYFEERDVFSKAAAALLRS